MKGYLLLPFSWAVIAETNRQLCLPKGALHKPTSDGHESARALWDSMYRSPMSLAEATELCRRCHKLAPFCNFNGNTFVAVIRRVLSTLELPPDQAAALRSITGHIVAGTATTEEQKAFAELLDRLPPSPDSGSGPGH